MGILNLTPDSFSDGSRYNSKEKALKKVLEMEKDGADIIDIGAEASGPNSKSISIEEELERLMPILKSIRKATKLPLSIDTHKAEVAKQALEEGANIINDVTAMRGDENMAKTVAEYKAPIVLMYSKDNSARTSIKNKKYADVIEIIKGFLEERVRYAKENGILSGNIILDPGMGHFISKMPKFSFEVIAKLERLRSLKMPILIGVSRKSFLGGKLQDRDEKGALLENIAYINGASIIRTHNVKTTKTCIKWSLV